MCSTCSMFSGWASKKRRGEEIPSPHATIRKRRTRGTSFVLSGLFVEQSENKRGTDLEPNHFSDLRQRHSKRSPSRSRYRSQSRVRKQRPTRFLSPCVHCACGLLRHLSRSSEMEVLARPSSQGAIISSHGSLW